MKKKLKRQFAWFPVTETGQIWKNWGDGDKKQCVHRLNTDFWSWRDDGFTVQKFELVPVKRRKRK